MSQKSLHWLLSQQKCRKTKNSIFTTFCRNFTIELQFRIRNVFKKLQLKHLKSKAQPRPFRFSGEPSYAGAMEISIFYTFSTSQNTADQSKFNAVISLVERSVEGLASYCTTVRRKEGKFFNGLACMFTFYTSFNQSQHCSSKLQCDG